MQLAGRRAIMANFSGHFVADIIRCFNNKGNFLALEFDHGEVLQIYLGEGKAFNTGEVLKIDNTNRIISLQFGSQNFSKRSSPFRIQDRYPVKGEEAGFYFGDVNGKVFEKLDDKHVHQLLSLKFLVEEGDFFMEIYDTAIPNVRVIQPARYT